MFCPVSGFPNYIINNEGLILKKSGLEMKHDIHKDGYHYVRLTNEAQKHFKIHRLVYQHFGNDWNPEMTVDHRDGDKDNNHVENLRHATHQQQQFNRKAYNKLGVKGVYQSRNKYQVLIRIDGKLIRLGLFDNVEEASLAYQTKARELHGDFFRN